MKILIPVMLSAVLAGCSGTPINQMSNYDLCRELAVNLPESTGRRITKGVLTLGLSEIKEAADAKDSEEIRVEMRKRDLPACDSTSQAKYECAKIYPDQSSPEFATCVLTTANTIEARISSDIAAEDPSGTAQLWLDAQV